MAAVRVYDAAMCCSTGICGPSVDPQLARFAADLDWLKSQGISVERFDLSQQPAAFAADAAVRSALETKGEAGLPLVKVNGEVKSNQALTPLPLTDRVLRARQAQEAKHLQEIADHTARWVLEPWRSDCP